MSAQGQPNPPPLYIYFLGAFAIILMAGALGLWLGSAPRPIPDTPADRAAPGESRPGEPAAPAPRPTPPLYFFANTLPGADLAAVAETVRMAAAPEKTAGGADVSLHRHGIVVPLPWPEHGVAPETALEPLRVVVEADPLAEVLVRVVLDPPQSWLDAHPDDAARFGETSQSMVSIASDNWMEAVRAGLESLIRDIEGSPEGTHVIGYIPACLENGQWHYVGGYDSSVANADGFRRWLTERYADDAALQAAWKSEEAAIETAAVPEKPETGDQEHVFFDLDAARPVIDYLQYLSESTGQTLVTLVEQIKGVARDGVKVYVPYGYTFELTGNASGHGALAYLLDSAVDGFLSPLSYFDRGQGPTGGFLGPVHSALYHDKQWLLVDDTRTGITRDPETGAFARLPGLRDEDVERVQRRNFAAAVTQGLGLCWYDSAGNGALCDKAIWSRLKGMKAAYMDAWSADITPVESGVLRFPQHPAGGGAEVFMAVVVDERVRAFQQYDAALNEILLLQGRDLALRLGIPTRFCLLSDVLEGSAPVAPIYLFLNAFRLTPEDRAALHALLTRGQSTAIWVYAPGYMDGETASAENVSATTLVSVKAFDKAAASGSAIALPGSSVWVSDKDPLGPGGTWRPLFYIDDEETNVLARFTDSDKASVAMTFVDVEEGHEGWTSIFIAEPSFSAGLLRETLSILDKFPYLRSVPPDGGDVIYFGPNLLAVHANVAGERTFDLGQTYDVEDILERAVGWPRKRTLTLPMRAGETRILRLTLTEE